MVLGTRSAVFAPLKNLGMVILDEEQESSYQSENLPRYHARDVAKFLCAENNAVLLLGSATPTVETAYYAKTGRYHAFSIQRRYNDRPLPRVVLADMRREVKQGNSGAVSGVLYEELRQNIERGEQSILFLNRRGSSRMLLCGECGARAGMSQVQRPHDLPQRQRAAHVSLLRPLGAGLGNLRRLRRDHEARGIWHPEGGGGAQGALSRRRGAAHGRGHRRRRT